MPARLLATVAQSHARQLALCGELERVADGLPGDVDRQHCLHLARAVCRTVSDAHAVEERILFPAVEAARAERPEAAASVERLRWEHMSDLCFAEEIHDALLDLGRGEERSAPEAVGYMLRGFFEGVRRHVAFERELLAPLLAAALGVNGAIAGGISRSAP